MANDSSTLSHVSAAATVQCSAYAAGTGLRLFLYELVWRWQLQYRNDYTVQ